MSIEVIVVDDEKFDRVSVRRRLSRHPQFGAIHEVDDGDSFLDAFYPVEGAAQVAVAATPETPLLVLMDINMRRLNGFETLAELQRRIGDGIGERNVTAVMLTSSCNGGDQSRADAFPIVRGFLTKPLSEDDVRTLLSLYGPLPEAAVA